MTAAATRPLDWAPKKPAISRVPYLPGLDGMRALAVGAVMVYHANVEWLTGGFLGVEVFFVISGYLITLLLIGEHERTGRISLGHFWLRRAKRLLPALFALLISITIYTSIFRRDALGQLRGDVLAGLTYVSNWYQLWVGQGYTSSGDFAPLRHLWSLAVEEQFYLVWPLVMVGLMHLGRRRLPGLSRWLLLAAVVVSLGLALSFHRGPIDTCQTTPEAFWEVGGRCLSKADTLYFSTISRASGLLLGAAFAMVWRPVALRRGAVRTKGWLFDLVALGGLAVLVVLNWRLHYLTPEGADPWLFRGGFFLTGVATIMVMAGVTHPGAISGRLLGNPVFLWMGTRSYGLYLYHWPIYQIIRRVAGKPLTVGQFALAMAITVPITEGSYRFIETPIRSGRVKRWWAKLQANPDPGPRRVLAGLTASLLALSVFSVSTMVTAELRPNEIAASLEAGESATVDLSELVPTGTSVAEGIPTTEPAASVAAPESSGAPATSAEPAATPTSARPGPDTPAAAADAGAPTTVATTTTAPGPTTTSLFPPNTTFALGDSVMLGAAQAMTDRGMVVNAEQNRQMNTMVPVVQGMRDSGALANVSVFVVHLGTNGPISEETVTQFFDALAAVPRVVVLSVRANRSWSAPNNELLFGLPSRYPNVQLLDWGGLSHACVGACYYDDGIHLNTDGRQYYAQLIQDFLAS